MCDRIRAGITSRFVISQLGQLSLASSRVAKLSMSLVFFWGKGGNVSSAGWWVTLCDLIWHMGSRSSVATSPTAISVLLTYFTYFFYTSVHLLPLCFWSARHTNLMFCTCICIAEWWGVGVVICLERGADLDMAQLMPLPLTVSCFSKIQIGLPFWYWLTRVVQ